MGLLSWIKNKFVSDEGSKSVSGISPVQDGEPFNAATLNRSPKKIGGRLELLNSELEVIKNNILSRKIIIECMARGWTGYAYVGNNGSVKFVAGSVGIPPNTSMVVKLIDQGDETTSTPTGSMILIGIVDSSGNKGFIIFKTKHTAQYDRGTDNERAGMPYSGDLIIRFEQGSNESFDAVTDNGIIQYFRITFTSSSTINTIASLIGNDNPYLSVMIFKEENTGYPSIPQDLSGKSIAASDIWYDISLFRSKYRGQRDQGYIIGTYKYVKSLEIEIPYDTLRSFFSSANNTNLARGDDDESGNPSYGLAKGSVLAVRLPLSNPDGTYQQAELAKASTSAPRIIINDPADLVVLGDNTLWGNVPMAVGGSNGIYIPIAKASSPSMDTINRYMKNDENVFNLSYLDFADGIRVGAGQIYCESVENNTCVRDGGLAPDSTDDVNVKVIDVASASVGSWIRIISPTDGGPYSGEHTHGWAISNCLVGAYRRLNSQYIAISKEGRKFLVKRDMLNKEVYIKFTDGSFLDACKASGVEVHFKYSKISNRATHIHPKPIPFDPTPDYDHSIFNIYPDTAIGELHGAVRRLGMVIKKHIDSSHARYKHISGSIDGEMIGPQAINASHITSSDNVWSFRNYVTVDGKFNSKKSNHSYSKTYTNVNEIANIWDTIKNNMGNAQTYSISVSGDGIKLGGSMITSTGFTLDFVYDIIYFPMVAADSVQQFEVVMYDGTNIVRANNTSPNPKKYLGVYLYGNKSIVGGFYSAIATRGVCPVKVVDITITRGSYLSLAAIDGIVGVDPNSNNVVGIALTDVFTITNICYVIAYLFGGIR